MWCQAPTRRLPPADGSSSSTWWPGTLSSTHHPRWSACLGIFWVLGLRPWPRVYVLSIYRHHTGHARVRRSTWHRYFPPAQTCSSPTRARARFVHTSFASKQAKARATLTLTLKRWMMLSAASASRSICQPAAKGGSARSAHGQRTVSARSAHRQRTVSVC